jgi:hypothetical protein
MRDEGTGDSPDLMTNPEIYDALAAAPVKIHKKMTTVRSRRWNFASDNNVRMEGMHEVSTSVVEFSRNK